ncbi:MAG: dihydrodipicolinate synthase family protein [Celeribacter sp.]|jgi:4-hydroxy-tetrahydrodipicolinate synthase
MSTADSAPRAHMFGVSAALVTPFTADGSIDSAATQAHVADLIERGIDGVTLFGTTGEGASLGATDRAAIFDAVLATGIAPARVTVCICATDLESAVAKAGEAFDRGITRLLLTPPFYFKGVSDDALFGWISGFVAQTAAHAPEIILYHIPQVTMIPLSPALIRRLKDAFPAEIYGVKDSAGDWDNTVQLLPWDDLAIMIGDERLLARAAPLGGAGSISGMANLFPERMAGLVHRAQPDADLDALVVDVITHPVTPMVKALVGRMRGDHGWSRTRLPLEPAATDATDALAQRCRDMLG